MIKTANLTANNINEIKEGSSSIFRHYFTDFIFRKILIFILEKMQRKRFLFSGK